MVNMETGLAWLIAALLAAFATPPADTQHARFAGPAAADRLMDVAPHRGAAEYHATGPPAALLLLSA